MLLLFLPDKFMLTDIYCPSSIFNINAIIGFPVFQSLFSNLFFLLKERLNQVDFQPTICWKNSVSFIFLKNNHCIFVLDNETTDISNNATKPPKITESIKKKKQQYILQYINIYILYCFRLTKSSFITFCTVAYKHFFYQHIISTFIKKPV